MHVRRSDVAAHKVQPLQRQLAVVVERVRLVQEAEVRHPLLPLDGLRLGNLAQRLAPVSLCLVPHPGT